MNTIVNEGVIIIADGADRVGNADILLKAVNIINRKSLFIAGISTNPYTSDLTIQLSGGSYYSTDDN